MADRSQAPVRAITDAEVDAFWTNGVVCLRGVLEPALLDAMTGPVDAAVAGTESADLSEMGRALAAAGESVPTCTTWCPLDCVGPETGAVRYARGSHRWDAVYRPNLFVSTMPIPGTEGELVPDVDALASAEVLTFETEPGDVVVHHARTLHAAGGNRSSSTRRRAISVRYCGDDARVLIRTGAPLKAYQRGIADGATLVSPDCPVVWRAP